MSWSRSAWVASRDRRAERVGASLRSASRARADAISEIEPTGPRSSWAARDTKSVRALSVRRSDDSRWLRRSAWPTSMAVSLSAVSRLCGGGVASSVRNSRAAATLPSTATGTATAMRSP